MSRHTSCATQRKEPAAPYRRNRGADFERDGLACASAGASEDGGEAIRWRNVPEGETATTR